jgi:rhomboid protease GluP
METYLKKIRHILPTLLIVVFGTVIGVSFIRWVLCIQFPVLDLKEEVWNLWIPLILPWIPILIWLRPRLRVLTFKKETDNRRVLFQFISWGIMTAMLFASQGYLTTATGKLESIKNIQQIDKAELARYYKIDKFAVAPNFGGSYTDFRTSGKYYQDLNFDVFFVTPILNDTSERLDSKPKYWYGVKYHKQISNKISNEEKEQKYQDFYNECIQKMNNYNFYSLDHFERKHNSDDLQNFLKAIEARTKQNSNEYIVLVPISENYESRNGNKFAWIFGAFGIGITVFLLLLIWPDFSETERKKFISGKKPKHDELIDMLKYLIPKDQHFVTSIILDLNILIFIIMFFSGINPLSPNGKELLEWGANRRFETMNGDWWRLLTSMFLHGGMMHLFLNIYGLVLAAIFVEPILGRKNYAILYMISGLCGSLASIWWYSNTVSVGASGAIFGLYGAILGLLLTDAFPKGGKRGMFIMIGIYVGINLIFGLTGGIDNAAHIGGLLSGALLGIILYKLDNEIKTPHNTGS